MYLYERRLDFFHRQRQHELAQLVAHNPAPEVDDIPMEGQQNGALPEQAEPEEEQREGYQPLAVAAEEEPEEGERVARRPS